MTENVRDVEMFLFLELEKCAERGHHSRACFNTIEPDTRPISQPNSVLEFHHLTQKPGANKMHKHRKLLHWTRIISELNTFWSVLNACTVRRQLHHENMSV